LRRLGYDRTMITAHGLRGLASTLLHECGWPSDVIERQLSNAERNAVKAAYNHAEHLPARRKMMQAWADHLDSPRVGGKAVSLRAWAICELQPNSMTASRPSIARIGHPPSTRCGRQERGFNAQLKTFAKLTARCD
jgi:hypothetical protein